MMVMVNVHAQCTDTRACLYSDRFSLLFINSILVMDWRLVDRAAIFFGKMVIADVSRDEMVL